MTRHFLKLAIAALVAGTCAANAGDAPLRHTDVWRSGEVQNGLAGKRPGLPITARHPGARPHECTATLMPSGGGRIDLQVYKKGQDWRSSMSISDRETAFGRYDRGQLDHVSGRPKVGQQALRPDAVIFLALRPELIDHRTSLRYDFLSTNHTADLMAALTRDGIEVPGVISATATKGSLANFRACAAAAMQIPEGTRLGIDQKDEYRQAFDQALQDWAFEQSRASSCFERRWNDTQVESIINRAAKEFHPGLKAVLDRKKFSNNQRSRANAAKTAGQQKMMTEGCAGGGAQADAALGRVEQTISAARIAGHN